MPHCAEHGVSLAEGLMDGQRSGLEMSRLGKVISCQRRKADVCASMPLTNN